MTVPNLFANQTGPVPLSQLDQNFAAATANMQTGTGATSRSITSKLNDFVNAADYGAVGDGSTDDTAAIQLALNTARRVYLNMGTYKITSKLIPPGNFELIGERRGLTILKAASAITIIELPINNDNVVIDKIYFGGTGATGIAVATTTGTFQGYFIRGQVKDCDFGYEMAYGINADCIYAQILGSTFGYVGLVGNKPAPGASTMTGIRSVVYPATTNYTNLNRISDCIFNCGKADASVASLVLNGGISWFIQKCDFSFGGTQLNIVDISMCHFDHCWFEGNTATNMLIKLDASTAPQRVKFTGCYLAANTCDRIWQHASTIPNQIDIVDCLIAKTTGSYCLYDNATTIRTLDGAGNIAFYNNQVAGDTVSDKCVTTTDFRGGATSPRFTGRFFSTGPAIKVCSDANLTISRNGVGDISVISSHPMGTSVDKIIPVLGGNAAIVRCSVVNTSELRLTAFAIDGTNGAAEETFSVAVYGS